MKTTVCQLVQQSETGWIVSLSNGAPFKTGEGSANGKQFASSTAGADGEPQQARLRLGGPAASSPAVVEDTSCKVIFDGVLYNQAELHNRFVASSSPPANDAALVLQAYLHWGEDMLHKVRGIFTLLI